jgi:Copper amine oxidase N-terminal domain
MKRFLAALLLALSLGGSALADDRRVTLTLDGRPVSRNSGVAVARDGVIYADVVDLTRAFNGLLTFHGPATLVTIDGKTATFTAGSRTAQINQGAIMMRGQAFMRNGDLFVPLDFFVTQVAGAKLRVNRALTKADIYVNANPLSFTSRRP